MFCPDPPPVLGGLQLDFAEVHMELDPSYKLDAKYRTKQNKVNSSAGEASTTFCTVLFFLQENAALEK